MKAAPQVEVYVARVAKCSQELCNADRNVAEAITWAAEECEADIVSMSFGFADKQPNISKAIRKALDKREESIIFFAAASNFGANEREMFPAYLDSVISVRGTNANGNFEDFNPPRSEREVAVFGTLGVDVPAAGLAADEVYKSGTSVATAVAAGIAGILLAYVNSKSGIYAFDDVKKKLSTCKGMQAMFRHLASDTLKCGCLYVTPWSLAGLDDETRWANFVVAMRKVQ
ncbi:uncharacterized protein LDX57_011387 [Aspergillus melleus]|uniref:uncharacterized protein n=1 Tax=Aspergillus melleus TaxID=138277 RepID=UPI001E8CB376|nr:uncharacterized protein LDX57_011387 [Aspergillus melleus]KAH8433753.1 hypothetical protein LDX57_011387 [Aspergillus melleus]